jgi:hypothetical protein
MGKKCIICEDEAKYLIKDTSDYYCEECANESFGDLSVLVSVEEQAKKIKKLLEEKIKEKLLEENQQKNSDIQ